jgi:hypothetical protein
VLIDELQDLLEHRSSSYRPPLPPRGKLFAGGRECRGAFVVGRTFDVIACLVQAEARSPYYQQLRDKETSWPERLSLSASVRLVSWRIFAGLDNGSCSQISLCCKTCLEGLTLNLKASKKCRGEEFQAEIGYDAVLRSIVLAYPAEDGPEQRSPV